MQGDDQEESVLRWRLRSFWGRLNNAFWFLPVLMTTGAVVLFAITWYADQTFEGDPGGIPVVFSGGATAARTLLSSIASALFTVAVTLFSITILTLQLASTSYSPRLLPRNFIGDRGAQVVLGIFLGTILYSFLGVRTIPSSSSGAAASNPALSAVALILVTTCVGAFIYFIAHLATIIQSSTIVQSSQEMTLRRVSDLRDLDEAHHEEDTATPLEDHYSLEEGVLGGEPVVLRARNSGYLQILNLKALTSAVAGLAAEGQDTIAIEIPHGPGHFVPAETAVARIWPAEGLQSDPKSKSTIYKAFVIGKERSFDQDFAFGIRQLSDIALIALSSNDSTTAMQAMDRMEIIFVALGKKEMPRRLQERESGGVRVLFSVGYYRFDEVVGSAFDQLRRAALSGGQVAVLERLLEVIERAIEENEAPERRKALWERAMAVARQVPQRVPDSGDAVSLLIYSVSIGSLLLNGEKEPEVEDQLDELANLSEDLKGGEQIQEAVRNARIP